MLPSDVSPALRIAQVAASIFFCFHVAGLVFGFAALKPVLIASGVYSDLCGDDSTCPEQDTKLNLLFVVATSTTNCASLPVGWFLDTIGPQYSAITGAAVFAAGTLTFGVGYVGTWMDTYMLGYFLMALGAPALFLAQFHLSNTFPSRSGLVLGSITGAFDASSFPLVGLKQVFFKFGTPSIHTFFTAYVVFPILMIIQQLTFAPRELYERVAEGLDGGDNTPPSLAEPVSPRTVIHPLPSVGEDDNEVTPTPASRRRVSRQPSYHDEGDSHIHFNSSTFSRMSAFDRTHASRSRRMSSSFSRIAYNVADDEGDEALAVELEKKVRDPVVGVMYGRPAKEQVTSRWFWVMLFSLVVHMTRINWYLATVYTQLVFYTQDEELADKLTDAFTVLLPLAGIAMIPAVGWLLDNRPARDVALTMCVLGFGFGVCTLLPATPAQLVGIACLVCFRPLFYTAISDYAAKAFGFETFGTVYGLAMTVSGGIGVVLNPLDRLVKGKLDGDYTPINVVLLVLGFVSTLMLAYQCSPRSVKLDEDREDPQQ